MLVWIQYLADARRCDSNATLRGIGDSVLTDTSVAAATHTLGDARHGDD